MPVPGNRPSARCWDYSTLIFGSVNRTA